MPSNKTITLVTLALLLLGAFTISRTKPTDGEGGDWVVGKESGEERVVGTASLEAQRRRSANSRSTPHAAPLGPRPLLGAKTSTGGGEGQHTGTRREDMGETRLSQRVAHDGEGQYPILRYPSTEINYKLGPTLAEGKRIEGDGDCSHFNAMPQKYLSFEPWPGGWNNRRLSLECAATLALLSNRTLILPPLAKGVHDDHIQGAKMMGYEDAYNMTMMQYFLPAVSFKEFLQCKGQKWLDSMPDLDPEERRRNCTASTPEGSKDRFYCLASLPVSRKAKFVRLSMIRNYYSVPLLSSKGGFPRDPFGLRRRLHALPGSPTSRHSANQSFLHFQRNLLSTFSNMVFIATDYADSSVSLRPSNFLREEDLSFEKPPTVRQRVFGALRDGLQYQDHIKRAAAHVVHKFLGGVDGFSAIHFRRKDFKLQYPRSVRDPCWTVGNLSPLYKVGETIFIASDDDHEVHEALKKCNSTNYTYPSDLQFHSWTSLLRERAGGDLGMLLGPDHHLISETQIPLVAQEICVAARIFSPNAKSTLSGLIVRLRGHREVPIKAIGPYYSTVSLPTVFSSPQPRNRNSSASTRDSMPPEGLPRFSRVVLSDWGVRRPLDVEQDAAKPYNLPPRKGQIWGQETSSGHQDVEFPRAVPRN